MAGGRKGVLDGAHKGLILVDMSSKDLKNALAMAQDVAAPAPAAEGVQDVYQTALAQGKSALDGFIIVTVLEQRAGVAVGQAAASQQED